MSVLLEELAARIRGEVPELGRAVERAFKAWLKTRAPAEDQEVYVDSAALNIHGFYSALERVFELIARHVDQSLPSGQTWHRDLLHQMGEDLAGARPAVISEDSSLALDELRRFRHLVRNVYTVDLKPEKMEGLMSDLCATWAGVRGELLAFADFLAEMATAAGDDT